MKYHTICRLVCVLFLSVHNACETTQADRSSEEHQGFKKSEHSAGPSTLREEGPQSIVKQPVKCPTGGAVENPSSNSAPKNANTIEIGVTTTSQQKGPRKVTPFIQHRCK